MVVSAEGVFTSGDDARPELDAMYREWVTQTRAGATAAIDRGQVPFQQDFKRPRIGVRGQADVVDYRTRWRRQARQTKPRNSDAK